MVQALPCHGVARANVNKQMSSKCNCIDQQYSNYLIHKWKQKTINDNSSTIAIIVHYLVWFCQHTSLIMSWKLTKAYKVEIQSLVFSSLTLNLKYYYDCCSFVIRISMNPFNIAFRQALPWYHMYRIKKRMLLVSSCFNLYIIHYISALLTLFLI